MADEIRPKNVALYKYLNKISGKIGHRKGSLWNVIRN